MIAANRIVIFVLCYNRGGNHKGCDFCRLQSWPLFWIFALGISNYLSRRVGLEVFVLTYLRTAAQICVRIQLLLLSCKRCLLVF